MALKSQSLSETSQTTDEIDTLALPDHARGALKLLKVVGRLIDGRR